MNHDEIQARLRDLSRGDLSDAEREAVAEHLDRCRVCAREMAASQDLASRLDALPRSVEPHRDLWPAIEAGVRTRARRPAPERADGWRWRRWRLRPIAGVAFGTLAVVLAVWIVIPRHASIEPPRTGSTGTMPPATASIEPIPAGSMAQDALRLAPTVRALESECTAVGKQILATLPGPPTRLTPSTAAAFEENLASLDRAIGETASALAEYPRDPALMRRLTAHYQRKLALLHEAARLASDSTA